MEDEGGGGGDAELRGQVAARVAEVEQLLKANNIKGALRQALESPPTTAKSKDIKDANADMVRLVLEKCGDTTIDALLDDLDLDRVDVLIKYIYRLLGQQWNAQSMLKWHERVVSKVGLGSLVRALADRKTV